jgi:hypothetical protein
MSAIFGNKLHSNKTNRPVSKFEQPFQTLISYDKSR